MSNNFNSQTNNICLKKSAEQLTLDLVLWECKLKCDWTVLHVSIHPWYSMVYSLLLYPHLEYVTAKVTCSDFLWRLKRQGDAQLQSHTCTVNHSVVIQLFWCISKNHTCLICCCTEASVLLYGMILRQCSYIYI